MTFYFTWQNIIIILSIIIYFIFDHFDGKKIKDEREELIKLKSLEFVQKINIIALFILSLTYFVVPQISGMIVIVVLILSALYSEILAKLYYRRNM